MIELLFRIEHLSMCKMRGFNSSLLCHFVARFESLMNTRANGFVILPCINVISK